jgi:hypothetical protein
MSSSQAWNSSLPFFPALRTCSRSSFSSCTNAYCDTLAAVNHAPRNCEHGHKCKHWAWRKQHFTKEPAADVVHVQQVVYASQVISNARKQANRGAKPYPGGTQASAPPEGNAQHDRTQLGVREDRGSVAAALKQTHARVCRYGVIHNRSPNQHDISGQNGRHRNTDRTWTVRSGSGKDQVSRACSVYKRHPHYTSSHGAPQAL